MNFTTYFIASVILAGVGTLFWSLLGLTRFIWAHRPGPRKTNPYDTATIVHKKDVAVLIAAHNESLIIGDTLRQLKKRLRKKQIFLVSDASSDRTAEIALSAGVHVYDLEKNRGKAGALVAGIKHFNLTDDYKVILILDADTHLSNTYFKTGLPLFNNADVVAVAGSAQTFSDDTPGGWIGKFLLAYRQRVYVISQILIKYGQAAHNVNAVLIVPGFASMYRSTALKSINIAAPGLIIEDYNMTFDVHTKKLGKIAFHPKKALAYTQDPDNLKDYIRQTYRWSLGFWQTVAKHKLTSNAFGGAVIFSIFDQLMTNLILCGYIVLIAIFILFSASQVPFNPDIAKSLPILIISVCIYDYVLTIIAAIYLKRYGYLVVGLLFPLMRIIEFWTFIKVLTSIMRHVPSNGKWKSPLRRPSTPLQPLSKENTPPQVVE